MDDLCKEIKYFKIFDKIEEVRNTIDESLKKNEKNQKKIFIISILKSLLEFLKEIQEKMNLNHLKYENRK